MLCYFLWVDENLKITFSLIKALESAKRSIFGKPRFCLSSRNFQSLTLSPDVVCPPGVKILRCVVAEATKVGRKIINNQWAKNEIDPEIIKILSSIICLNKDAETKNNLLLKSAKIPRRCCRHRVA